MEQPFSKEGAPRRAFSLKTAYMRTILQFVLDSGANAVANFSIQPRKKKRSTLEPLVTSEELSSNSFDEVIYNRLTPFFGKNYRSIAQEREIDLSNNPKSKLAMIAHNLISEGKCSNVNRSEEFTKAGLTMKTIRVQANGNIKEAMSFENIDYLEVAECENWYESRLYELFSSRFMFVVYREQTPGAEDYVLSKAFFWTMPQKDLEIAEEYWEHIRKNVLEDHISREFWWKGTDRRSFHVRPKGKNSADLAPTPSGKKAKKYCYWFNNDYIRKIVNDNVAE